MDKSVPHKSKKKLYIIKLEYSSRYLAVTIWEDNTFFLEPVIVCNTVHYTTVYTSGLTSPLKYQANDKVQYKLVLLSADLVLFGGETKTTI